MAKFWHGREFSPEQLAQIERIAEAHIDLNDELAETYADEIIRAVGMSAALDAIVGERLGWTIAVFHRRQAELAEAECGPDIRKH
jgi:hypothetical protein